MELTVKKLNWYLKLADVVTSTQFVYVSHGPCISIRYSIKSGSGPIAD